MKKLKFISGVFSILALALAICIVTWTTQAAEQPGATVQTATNGAMDNAINPTSEMVLMAPTTTIKMVTFSPVATTATNIGVTNRAIIVTTTVNGANTTDNIGTNITSNMTDIGTLDAATFSLVKIATTATANTIVGCAYRINLQSFTLGQNANTTVTIATLLPATGSLINQSS